MIGCLIFGSLAAMGIARAIHRHRYTAVGAAAGTAAGTTAGTATTAAGRLGRPGRGRPRRVRRLPRAGPRWGRLSGLGADSDRGGGGAASGSSCARILEHVRATPAQERVIGAAFEEFRDEMKQDVGGEGRRTRQGDGRGAPPPHLRRRGAGRAVRAPRHDHGERRASRSSAWWPRFTTRSSRSSASGWPSWSSGGRASVVRGAGNSATLVSCTPWRLRVLCIDDDVRLYELLAALPRARTA